MQSDKNSNKGFPLLNNQLPNERSQIINYYINLTPNLNMNNLNYEPKFQFPLRGNSPNSDTNEQNSDQIFANAALLKSYINMFNMLQVQASCQQYSQLFSHINNTPTNKKEHNSKEDLNLTGKKRKRKAKINKKDNINKKADKNIKNIIKEKNGNFQKNQIKQDVLNEDNSNYNIINFNNTNQSSLLEQKNKIIIENKDINKKNEVNDGFKNNEDGNNKNNKPKRRKRNVNKELLQDTLLEHLDVKNDISIIIDNSGFADPKIGSKEKKTKKNVNENKTSLKFKNSNKTRNKSEKNHNIKRHRYTTHYTNKKKEKTNILNPHGTEVIFHGENYEKTNSVIDFMKYNYNFIEENKPKKMKDPKKQAADVELPRIIYTNNYENNKYNLSDIKPIWLRSKFNGNNSELSNLLSQIQKDNEDERNYMNEEKCIEKLNGDLNDSKKIN